MAGLRPDAHVAAVVLHDVLDDAEAEARAARRPGSGLVDAEEALEDAVEILLGDPDALIGDRDLDDVATRSAMRSTASLTGARPPSRARCSTM